MLEATVYIQVAYNNTYFLSASSAASACTCCVSRFVVSKKLWMCAHLVSSDSTFFRSSETLASVCESPRSTDSASASCFSSSDARRFLRSSASELLASMVTIAVAGRGALLLGQSASRGEDVVGSSLLVTSVLSSAFVDSISSRELSSLCTRACSAFGCSAVVVMLIASF